METYLKGLFWLARVLTGDDDSAILCLAEAIDRGQPSRRNVIHAAYLRLSFEIKIASLEVKEFPMWKDRPAAIAEDSIDSDLLREALVNMNLFLRFVWVLRFAEGYSRNETASLLNAGEDLVDIATRQSAVDLACRLTRTRSQTRSQSVSLARG